MPVSYVVSTILGFVFAALLAPPWLTIAAGLTVGASYVPAMLISRGIRSPSALWAVLMNHSNIPSNVTLGWATTTIGCLMLVMLGHVAAEFILPLLSRPVADIPSHWLIILGAGGFIGLRLAKRYLRD